MVPEYLMYKLTGVKKKEFTNATTTGMVNAETLEFDRVILTRLGLPARLFPKLSRPGTVLGGLLPEIAGEVGGSCKVLLCATHDTASAVEGIPMDNPVIARSEATRQSVPLGEAERRIPTASVRTGLGMTEGEAPYISSGTWSLLGVKTPKPLTDDHSQNANFSNEGGVGYNRYQKNIMGMWLVNRLRDELCPGKPFPEIVAEAQVSRFDELVNADAEIFLAPSRMKTAFDLSLESRPQSPADYFRCAYRSLALSYKNALDELERNTGKSNDKLYIVGGGAKNQFLNDLTAHFTGKQVIALPIEATAIGNLKIQMNL